MAKQRGDIDYYDEREVMPPEERQEYYNSKLQQQLRYAYDHAPAMKAKFDSAGVRPADIRTVKDMEKLPITAKDELIGLRQANPPFGGLLGVPTEKLDIIFMSPGPIYDVQALDDSFFRRFHRAFYSAGFRPGDMVVNCLNYHMVPSGHWVEQSLTSFGATVIPMGVGNTELQVQALLDMQPTGWIGICGFLMIILNKAEEMGYDVRRDFSLRVACPHGEMGGDQMRQIYEEKYGITSTDIYPTADVGVVGYECQHKGGLHIPEEMLVEIVNPETGEQVGPGEAGEVVVTPLDTTTYPLIRLGTGDLSSYTDEPCACGRTSPKLTRVLGRVGDAVRARGLFIHPRQTNEVAANFPKIGRYQIVVSRPQFKDELTFKIELADEAIDKEKLATEVKTTFQQICRLNVDRVEFVSGDAIPDNARSIVDERTY